VVTGSLLSLATNEALKFSRISKKQEDAMIYPA
jgi:hypothetical protein